MSAALIKAALQKSLIAIEDLPPVRYDNVAFTMPANTPWIDVMFSPNPAYPVTVGDLGEDQIDGFIQFSVFGPSGEGEAAHNALLAKLLAVFKPGTNHFHYGQHTQVTKSGRGPGFNVDHWWTIPVTVTFYSRQPRNP